MRILKSTHDQMFEVFAGNEEQAELAHLEFTSWLASNSWGQAAGLGDVDETAGPHGTLPPTSSGSAPT
jgi:hypothetical protein